MKEITKTSRLAGQLEKLFNLLNADFFDGELETPVITIQSTPRAYGHYVPADIWSVKGSGYREINLGAGTLDRPIDCTVATLLHEMCHMYNDLVLNVQDCSRNGTYHNRIFAQTATAHGLIVTRTEKYGWSRTSPSDYLLQWILDNDIREIELSRNEAQLHRYGTSSTEGGDFARGTTKSSVRRYVCPCCRTIVRATRSVNVLCGDCMRPMMEE